MQENSLVQAVVGFDDVRSAWGFDYPNKGDILTIRKIEPHGNEENRKKGMNLLWFHEKPDLVGMCDKTFYGEWNFVEIQEPMEVNVDEIVLQGELEIIE